MTYISYIIFITTIIISLFLFFKFKRSFSSQSIVVSKFEGRLGNNLFQLATAYSVSKKTNRECRIFETEKTKNMDIFNRFKTIKYTEIGLHFNENKFTDYSLPNILHKNKSNTFDTLILNGLYQNYNNFHFCRDEFISLLNIPNVRVNINFEKYFYIHIRLTDFLDSELHNINLEYYYINAINYLFSIENDLHFVIISDDIKNAEFFLLGLKEKYSLSFRYIVLGTFNEVETLSIFTQFKRGGIQGHSTFAWWGSYLNNSSTKIVVIPNIFVKQNLDFSGFYFPQTVVFTTEFILK